MVGIKYQEVTNVTNQNKNDWQKFAQSKSMGITQKGQLLLPKAIESYVYAVLGAQIKTRWVIVGDGARSLQTQQSFNLLIEDTIAQSKDGIAIQNMRAAITNSNVVLDMGTLPGIILIPSKLMILDSPILGYNNTLTIANRNMSFGTNSNVNFNLESNTEPLVQKQEKKKKEPVQAIKEASEEPIPLQKEDTHTEELVYLFSITLTGAAILLNKTFLLYKKKCRSKNLIK